MPLNLTPLEANSDYAATTATHVFGGIGRVVWPQRLLR
jgi:hypothetical protein